MSMTKRELAAVIGLLLFASRVVAVSLADYYWPMRFWRETMSTTHRDEWSCPLPPMSHPTAQQLSTWIKSVLQARPTQITSPTRAPDLAIFVDASAQGWGVVAARDGGVICAGQSWPDPVDSSVITSRV